MAKAKTPAMGVQWSKTRGVKLENVLMTGNWGPWNGPTSHSDRYESRKYDISKLELRISNYPKIGTSNANSPGRSTFVCIVCIYTIA